MLTLAVQSFRILFGEAEAHHRFEKLVCHGWKTLENFIRIFCTIKLRLNSYLPNVKGTTFTSKISLIQIPPTGALSLENIRTATCKQIR